MLTLQRKQELELEFFSKSFTFSYSSINKLLYSPSVFYQEYVLKEREIRTDTHLVEGQLIHFLLLPDQNFKDRFIVAPDGLPSGYGKIAIEELYAMHSDVDPATVNLQDYKSDFLEIFKRNNFYQSFVDDKKAPFKTGDEKRLEKALTPENEAYFKYLFDRKNKELVTDEMLDKCQKIVEVLKKDEAIRDLLGLDYTYDPKKVGVYNELKHDMPIGEGDEKLRLGGIIDNVVVLVDEKKIRINDVKTTGKSISLFTESVDFYNYWIQEAIYRRLVTNWLTFVDETWTIEFRFLVIDKYGQYYPFLVTDETAKKWDDQLNDVLMKAKYHYNQKSFTLPYEFVTTGVTL